jgi:putative ABC transport system substrate-binding protein
MQFDQLKRREFISLLGAATAWPLSTRAQQPAMPVIGYLDGRSANSVPHYALMWRTGLHATGFTEGRTATIEARWAEGRLDRLPELAADLVRRPVDVMFAAGNAAALAAKTASGTTPIVFIAGFDPVEAGLVTSLNRPGGNVTGVSLLISAVVAKRLELLHELVPSAAVIAVMFNPTNPDTKSNTRQIEIAARALSVQLLILGAAKQDDIAVAFASAVQQKAGALFVQADVFFDTRLDHIVALSARHGIPAIYSNREYVVAGGLLSYGEDRAESYRQAGIYLGRVLKGEKPVDLPVLQPTKFELVINLKTAKALGIEVPLSMLMRVDETIE